MSAYDLSDPANEPGEACARCGKPFTEQAPPVPYQWSSDAGHIYQCLTCMNASRALVGWEPVTPNEIWARIHAASGSLEPTP